VGNGPLLCFGEANRSIRCIREPVTPCIDIDGCGFLANAGEEAQKNEGDRTHAKPHATHRLNRVDCVSQEHGKSPDLVSLGRKTRPAESTIMIQWQVFYEKN
jgi:hypothetical protein